jgi:hypothetical protein
VHKYLKLFLFFSLFACRAQATESAACGSLASDSLVSLAGTASAVQSAAQEGIWADNESLKAAMKRGTYDFFENMGLKDFKKVYDQDVKKPNAPLDSAVTAFLNIASSNTKTIDEKKEAFNKVVEQFTKASGSHGAAAPVALSAPPAAAATKAPTPLVVTNNILHSAESSLQSPELGRSRGLQVSTSTASASERPSVDSEPDFSMGEKIDHTVGDTVDDIGDTFNGLFANDENKGGAQWPASIKNYSSSSQVRGMIESAVKNAKRRSGGLCFNLVKYALCRPDNAPQPRDMIGGRRYQSSKNGRRQIPPPISGQTCASGSVLGSEAVAPAGHARDAVNTLTKPPYNFTNLLNDPKYKHQMRGPADSPLGAIITYKKINNFGCYNSKYGHIEINAGAQGFVSDFIPNRGRSVPISREPYKWHSYCYKVTGVLVKEQESK